GDQDYYQFFATAGQYLTVDIDSAVFDPSQPPAKCVVTVFDPDHVAIATDAYTSTDPEDPFVQVQLAATGVYTVAVRELRAFVGTPNTYYQMSVSLGPSLDDGTFATGLPVSAPRAVSGVVSPSTDIDHFRFNLPTASTIHLDVDAREDLLSLL